MQPSSQRERFRQDALRWVVPGQIADEATLTAGTLARLLYQHMSLRAMAWYRFACWCQEKRIPAAYGIITRRILARFGLEIWGEIEGGLYIAHPAGTVVAVKSMGKNCNVIASVTFGMRNEHAFPVIGEGVFVGAGARVLGNVTVGDHAKIGANAVVIHDVAADSTVIGIPAKPIASNNGVQTAPLTTNEYAAAHEDIHKQKA